jgi:hypothetical protein
MAPQQDFRDTQESRLSRCSSACLKGATSDLKILGVPSRTGRSLLPVLVEGKHSPNTKYRSRSALLQERASKLISGSGELTTRSEPAVIGCEA